MRRTAMPVLFSLALALSLPASGGAVCGSGSTVQIEVGPPGNQTLWFQCDTVNGALGYLHPGEHATVKLQGITLTESPVIGVSGSSVSIRAGYNDAFSGQRGMSFTTTLNGRLTIQNCSVTVAVDPSFIEPSATGYLTVAGDVEVISGTLVADALVIR